MRSTARAQPVRPAELKLARLTPPTIRASILDVVLTANARPMGSRQSGKFESHRHSFALTPGGWTGGGGGSNGFMVMGAGSGGVVDPTGGSETRPINVAFPPRIHA